MVTLGSKTEEDVRKIYCAVTLYDDECVKVYGSFSHWKDFVDCV